MTQPTWNDISSDERFQSLPFEKKQEVRDAYFRDFVSKAVPTGMDMESAYQEFTDRATIDDDKPFLKRFSERVVARGQQSIGGILQGSGETGARKDRERTGRLKRVGEAFDEGTFTGIKRSLSEYGPTGPLAYASERFTQGIDDLIPDEAINDILTEVGRGIGETGAINLEAAGEYGIRRPDKIREEPLQAAKYYGAHIAESLVGDMAPSIAVGVINPIAGLATLATKVWGETYSQLRAEGKSVEEATEESTFRAAAETIPEMIPMGLALRPLGKVLEKTGNPITDIVNKAMQSKAGSLVTVGAAEAVSEDITEISNVLYDKYRLDKEISFEDFKKQLKDAAVMGFGMGVGMRGGAMGLQAADAWVQKRFDKKPSPPGDLGDNIEKNPQGGGFDMHKGQQVNDSQQDPELEPLDLNQPLDFVEAEDGTRLDPLNLQTGIKQPSESQPVAPEANPFDQFDQAEPATPESQEFALKEDSGERKTIDELQTDEEFSAWLDEELAPMRKDLDFMRYDTPEQKKEAAKVRASRKSGEKQNALPGQDVNPAKDNLLVLIAKAGGLNSEHWASEFDVDIKGAREKGQINWIAGASRQLFSKYKKAMNSDQLAEWINQSGYGRYGIPENYLENGELTANTAGQLVHDMMVDPDLYGLPEFQEAKDLAAMIERAEGEYERAWHDIQERRKLNKKIAGGDQNVMADLETEATHEAEFYNEDWNAESRTLADWVLEAEDHGVSREELISLVDAAEDQASAVRSINKLIEAKREENIEAQLEATLAPRDRGVRIQEEGRGVQASPEREKELEQETGAEDLDVLGEDTSKPQALADREREKGEKRSGKPGKETVPVGAGAGDLFSGASKQRDFLTGDDGFGNFDKQADSSAPSITKKESKLPKQEDRPTTYWKGDKARYTGKQEDQHGATFYELEMLEGHLKGEFKWTQREPVSTVVKTKKEIDAAANEAATSPKNDKPQPSEAQKEAGNYKKGHLTLHGFDITIENPKGSIRTGKGWKVRMKDHYGYLKRTTGNDGDQVDIFLGPNAKDANPTVAIVDQRDQQTGKFDEHKILLGYEKGKAEETYFRNYNKAFKDLDVFAGLKEVSLDELREWLDSGDLTVPYGDGTFAKEKDDVSRQESSTGRQQGQERGRREAQQGQQPPDRPGDQTEGRGVEGQEVAPKQAEEGAQAPSKPDDRIEDFGAKIGGARKDIAKLQKAFDEITGDDEIASLPLSKVWPDPDYQAMLEAGYTREALALMKVMRDQVPAKPRTTWKKKQWVEEVKQLRKFASDIINKRQEPEHLIKQMKGSYFLKRLVDHYNLALEVGFPEHSGQFKHYRLSAGDFTWFEGKEQKKPLFKHFATYHGRILGHADTKEEAIEFIRAEMGRKKGRGKTKFVAYRKRGDKTGGVWVGKKVGKGYIDLHYLEAEEVTSKSGKKRMAVTAGRLREYLESHHDELVELLKKKKHIPPHRNVENRMRKGVDRREGASVTPEMFTDTFGFRGVEFGNWVDQKRRQDDLDNAYDSLLDLAETLGIPPKAISLNGELGIAFGSRGRGGKQAPSAHYESDRVVINLTKKKGPGSLAHEWWHSLDNYFSRARGKKHDYLTDKAYRRVAKSTDDIDPTRMEMIKAFKKVNEAMTSTGIFKRSEILDKRRTKPYWSTRIEMSARAFEAYVKAKIENSGSSNDYLANIVAEEIYDEPKAYPYPKHDEFKQVIETFDKFFKTVEMKETDTGVAMFNRALDLGFETQSKAGSQAGQTTFFSKQLEAAMGLFTGETVKPGTFQQVTAPKAHKAAVNAVERVFGKRVVFFRVDASYPIKFNGVTLPRDPKTIYISIDSKNPFMGVVGHELLHTLRTQHPDLYTHLAGVARSHMKSSGFTDFAVREDAKVKDNSGGRRLTDDKMFEEMVANVVGEAFLDPAFVKELSGRDQSLYQRILNAIIDILKTFQKRVKQRGMGAGRYFSDLQGLVDKVQNTLKQFPVKQPSAPGEGSAPAFSRGGQSEMDFNPEFTNFTLPNSSLYEAFKDEDLSLIDKLIQGTAEKRFRWRQQLQDKMLPLKRAQEAIEKSGGTVGDFINVYEKEELIHGRVGHAFTLLERDTLDPLAKIMAKQKVGREEIGEYLYARHARARNARIAKVNEAFPDGGSGMTNAEADEILEGFRNRGRLPVLRKLAKIIDSVTAKTRDNYKRYGLLDDRVIDAWEEDTDFNDTYVPLRGFDDAETEQFGRPGKGFDVRGTEVRRALGRRSKPADIIGNVISSYKMSVLRGEKNRVGQSLLKLAYDHPNKNLWEIDYVKTKFVIDKKTGMAKEVVDINLNDPNVFYTKVKGKAYRIELKDKRMTAAMKNLGADNMGSFMRGLASITRYLSITRTMLAPEFPLTNFARDIQTAGINLQGEKGKEFRKKAIGLTPKEFRKTILRGMRAIFNESRAGNKGDQEWLQYAKDFRNDGAHVDFFREKSVEGYARDVDRMVRLAQEGKWAAAQRAGWSALKFVEDLNGAVENAVRLSAYKAGREMGMSRQKAAVLSKNLTVNFNKKGLAGPQINALFMFYNASIQGVTRFLQASKNPKVRRLLYTMAASAAAITFFNELAGGEDDDGESFYSKIPDFEKERNLIFMIPQALVEKVRGLPGFHDVGEGRRRGVYFKFMLPYGYSIPYSAGEAATSVAFGAEPSEAALRFMMAVNNSFNPVGDSRLATLFAPTLADPFIEIVANRNYFGGPIYKADNPFESVKTPDSEKGWATTGEFFRWAARLMNKASGGDEVESGAIDLHPETMRHMLDFAFGGMGAFIGRAYENTEAIFSSETDLDVNRLIFARKVFGTTRDFQDRDRYYRNKEVIGVLDKRHKMLQQHAGAGEIPKERVAEWRENHSEILRSGLIPRLKAAEKRLRKLRKDRNRFRTMPDTDRNRETIKKIEGEILKTQIGFNTRYNQVMLDKGFIRSWIEKGK